jgi:hypothetical protein
MWPVRALDLAVIAIGAAAVGALVARTPGRADASTRGRADAGAPGGVQARAGWWTALLLVLAYYATDFWNTAQPDAWIAALAAIAMMLLIRDDIAHRPVLLLFASLLMGAGLLQKPTFGAWLVLPGLAVLTGRRDSRGNSTALRGVGMALVATLVALLPAAITAWWFQRQGALPALIEGYLTMNLEASRSAVGGVPRALAWSLHKMLTTTPLVAAVPGAVLGTAWLWRRDRRTCVLLLTWALTSWLMVAVQRRYFAYHWHPLLFSLAPSAGIGYAAALRWPDREFASPASRILAASAIGMLLIVLLLPLQVRVRDSLAWGTGRMDAFTYLAQFPPLEASPVAADLRLAEYLGTHSAPGDRVVVWDSPLANTLARREAPTRIGFFFPLVTPRFGGGSHAPGPAQQRLRQEYLAGLDDPATRIVAVSDDALRGVEPQPRKSIPMLFPELAERLDTGWTMTDSAGAYRIFTRRAP